jgi:hypothetical protein
MIFNLGNSEKALKKNRNIPQINLLKLTYIIGRESIQEHPRKLQPNAPHFVGSRPAGQSLTISLE